MRPGATDVRLAVWERELVDAREQTRAVAPLLAAEHPEATRGMCRSAIERSALRIVYAVATRSMAKAAPWGRRMFVTRFAAERIAPLLLGRSLTVDTTHKMWSLLQRGGMEALFDKRGMKRRQRRSPVNSELFATYTELREGGCPPKRAVRRVARGRAWPPWRSVEARYRAEREGRR